jgi:LemA protein
MLQYYTILTFFITLSTCRRPTAGGGIKQRFGYDSRVAVREKTMAIGSLLFIGLVVVAVVYLAMLYNGLVTVKHNVAKAWANIDVLLKQRHDELPKLVEVCKQYKQFEQETLARVIEARSRVQSAREQQDVGALGQAEGALRAGVGQIFAVAEAYPDLKTNANFMQLQQRITSLENAIADLAHRLGGTRIRRVARHRQAAEWRAADLVSARHPLPVVLLHG